MFLYTSIVTPSGLGRHVDAFSAGDGDSAGSRGGTTRWAYPRPTSGTAGEPSHDTLNRGSLRHGVANDLGW
jgi:hypothetical protein